ncbi:hypothetical protein GH714_022830 [Hevea brasiliensis]|uniref:Rubicon Homology domain-containing protein n=1 Tax=Hevea brasiliensis TaxID=3981 RepID=A0A6A6MCP1_HEVBR|nr:hypothetical protein GH714_022830 [Hevea brasiliensis]
MEGRGGEEDEISSRYEHSEDDSMYGCGSDDENRKNLYTQSRQYSKNENVENENPLLINSSVAFGSEDWDDFEQETGGGNLTSLTLDNFQEQKKQDFVTERNLFNSKSTASICTVIGLTERGKDVSTESSSIKQVEENELIEDFNTFSAVPIGSQNCGQMQAEVARDIPVSIGSQNCGLMQAEEARDIPVSICKVQGTCELAKDYTSTSIATSHLPSSCKLQEENVRGISDTFKLVQGANDTTNLFKSGIFDVKQDPFVEKNPRELGSNITDCSMQGKCLCLKSEIIRVDDSKVLDNQEIGNLNVKVDPLSDATNQLYSHPTEHFENENLFEDDPAPVKADKVELNEIYDEIVNEMEEILLDSSESPGAREAEPGNISTLGKTISLIVEIKPYKSMKQLLEAQHYTCAGCHKHFDDGMTLVRDFVQALGWGKPQICEYTGQLFCSSCHTNETAVLPARVLHYWDFTQYPVSQLAKSYLDSIHEQEDEIERCTSCESVFHKTCFGRLTNCSCGVLTGEEKTMGATNKLSRKASDLLGRKSGSVCLWDCFLDYFQGQSQK